MSSPASNDQVCAVILNGGRARRMGGQDKSTLVIEGRSIIDRQLEVLQPRFAPIAMVGGQPDSRVEELHDVVGGLGPVDGLAAALDWASTEWLLLVACDQPFLEPKLLQLLLDSRVEGDDLVVSQTAGRPQPMPGLYHRHCRSVVHARLEKRALRLSDLCTADTGLSVRVVGEEQARLVDPTLRSFANLNAPKDLVLASESSKVPR